MQTDIHTCCWQFRLVRWRADFFPAAHLVFGWQQRLDSVAEGSIINIEHLLLVLVCLVIYIVTMQYSFFSIYAELHISQCSLASCVFFFSIFVSDYHHQLVMSDCFAVIDLCNCFVGLTVWCLVGSCSCHKAGFSH